MIIFRSYNSKGVILPPVDIALQTVKNSDSSDSSTIYNEISTGF
jgi:hypothetical protein